MQEHAISTEGPRVRALDGLRGIALLLVFHDHLVAISWLDRLLPVPFAPAFDRGVFRALGAGWAGVDLFFVLSGFLITGILLDAKHKAAFFRNFYARRILRIFPLYYGFLLVALIAVTVIPNSRNPVHDVAQTTSLPVVVLVVSCQRSSLGRSFR